MKKQGCILFHRFWKRCHAWLKKASQNRNGNIIFFCFPFPFFCPSYLYFLSIFFLFSFFPLFSSFSSLLSSPFEKLPNLFWNHPFPRRGGGGGGREYRTLYNPMIKPRKITFIDIRWHWTNLGTIGFEIGAQHPIYIQLALCSIYKKMHYKQNFSE